MKGFGPILPRAICFPHSADVYVFNIAIGCHPTTSEVIAYESIPCFGERATSNFIETMLGNDAKGNWKVNFPLTFSGSDVTIKEGYTFFLTGDDGIERKMRVETVNIHASTHISVEANEDDVYKQ